MTRNNKYNWKMFLLSGDRVIRKIDNTGKLIKCYIVSDASKDRLVNVVNNNKTLSMSIVSNPYGFYTCISRGWKKAKRS